MLSHKKEENIYGSGLREMNLIFCYPRKMVNVTVAFLLTGGGKFTGGGGCGLVAKLYPTLVTPWTVAHQAPLPIEFSRHQYWSRLPFPSPGDLLDPGIKPRSPTLQADSLPTELGEKTYSQGLFLPGHSKIPLVPVILLCRPLPGTAWGEFQRSHGAPASLDVLVRNESLIEILRGCSVTQCWGWSQKR